MQVVGFFGQTSTLIDELSAAGLSPAALKSLVTEAETLAEELTTGGSAGQRELLVDIVEGDMVAEDTVTVYLKQPAIASSFST